MKPSGHEGQPHALLQVALGAEVMVSAKAQRWGDCLVSPVTARQLMCLQSRRRGGSSCWG